MPCAGQSGRWRDGEPPDYLFAPPGHGRDSSDERGDGSRDDLRAIGARLEWLCQPYSCRAVQDITGINHESIRRIVNGTQPPSLDLVLQVCTKGLVSVDWLLFGVGPVWCDHADHDRIAIKPVPTARLIMELLRRSSALDEQAVGAAVYG